MTRILRGSALTAVLVLAAACTDSAAPRTAISDGDLIEDVASDVNTATGLDLEQMALDEVFAGLAAAPPPAPPACTYSALVGRFLCPTIVTAQGITIQRSFALYDAGAPQGAFDPVATDSINFQAFRTGVLGGAARTMWINHARNATISGLSGTETERVWNGTGLRADSVRVTANGVTRLTRINSIDRIDGVAFAVPRTQNPFPLRGTITHDIRVTARVSNNTGENTRNAVRHVEVTFDGTRIAQMRIGTLACTLDLATRVVDCGR